MLPDTTKLCQLIGSLNNKRLSLEKGVCKLLLKVIYRLVTIVFRFVRTFFSNTQVASLRIAEDIQLYTDLRQV